MQLLCRNDDLTYFLGEEKNVVYGSCKRLWFWVDGRFHGLHILERDAIDDGCSTLLVVNDRRHVAVLLEGPQKHHRARRRYVLDAWVPDEAGLVQPRGSPQLLPQRTEVDVIETCKRHQLLEVGVDRLWATRSTLPFHLHFDFYRSATHGEAGSRQIPY